MNLVELQDVIENEGWSVEKGFNNGEWELSKFSPAGEDFSFTVEHKGDPERAVNEISDYAFNFDEDEHSAPLIEIRGTCGVPDSILVLAQDAKDIRLMLRELERACLNYQRNQRAIA